MTTLFATEGSFLLAAQQIVKARKNRNFKSYFGTSPKVMAVAWNMFIHGCKEALKFKHLLWACMHLKIYSTETVLAGMAGVVENTFRKFIWIVIPLLCGLVPRVMKLSGRFLADKGRTCKLTVDCTDCMLLEPSPFSKKWYCFKHKCAGYRYEVGVCIQTGYIVWINGPFKCGTWNDLSIFRRNLKHRLLPGEMVECDAGYRGDPKCRHKHVFLTDRDARAKARARARHENVNSEIKKWKCTATPWRHERAKHKLCFGAVAVLTQIGFQVHGIPHHVTY
ncbi:unknown protein [Seminavis robusta]|uniref:DDE Tnp4 domain-containing protein n=1 Tax=Seminavis robusta TaxID=568900 RepID=A0A9N8DLN8_9STRA|nr:unknown protein [Seminavis robusta]|eukprot:Sro124_g059880.1 n/a (279) ;mRNA; f:51353-52254